MEDQTRPLSGMGDDFRLCHFFDYIAGTSTGAIIASGLAIGKSAAELIEFYRSSGAAMFQRASLTRRFFYHMFSADRLREMLRKEVGAESLLEMQQSGKLKTLLLIVTRNVTTDAPGPISTNPNAQFNDESLPDCNMRIPSLSRSRSSPAIPSTPSSSRTAA